MTQHVLSAALCIGVATHGVAGDASDPSVRLHRLFDEQWEFWMRESPTWASGLGDRRYNRLWPEETVAAAERRAEHDRAVIAKLETIDRTRLSAEDRLNLDLFALRLREDVEEAGYGLHLMPLTQRGGIQTAYELAENLRFDSLDDYEDWNARLTSLGQHVDQTIELMRAGVRAGIVQPRVVMERVPAQVAHLIVESAEESPFYKPLRDIADAVPPAEHARLRREAGAAITNTVVPAYRRFLAFFTGEYLPATRTAIGISSIPRGREIYAFRARQFTTTELTPQAIHDLGLKEVARIRGEMDRIIRDVGFVGDFAAFLHFLRTDPRFYHRDGERLLEAYRAVAKRADPELVKLFGKLPRAPYGVKPIPMDIAPDTTTAYYGQPAADGSRAGTYWVNLYKPEERPIYEMEALSLHEAVPGHHLQIALSQELGELPKFRRYTGYTAFTEGWGLYAESLGEEMGFYQDPYSKFGQLTYEMWRAVRLVVDTGIHFFDWDRDRAIAFFKANAAKTELDIINEVDRYIAWPGQALAYKIGELKIKELRQRAVAKLGDRFDIRAFHDLVLGSGAIPLGMLEERVDVWIAERARPAP